MRRLSGQDVEGEQAEFQDAGPDEQKARGPSVTVVVLCSSSCQLSADRSCECPGTNNNNHYYSISVSYVTCEYFVYTQPS